MDDRSSRTMEMRSTNDLRSLRPQTQQVLHDRACQASAITRLSSFAKLIDDEQAATRGQAQCEGYLLQIHHESALDTRYSLARRDPRKNVVRQPDLCAICRDEASDMGHVYDERDLLQVHAFA